MRADLMNLPMERKQLESGKRDDYFSVACGLSRNRNSVSYLVR